MTQMRKFEQEAIAKEILDTIKDSNSKEQQAMEKSSKELKDIHKLSAKIIGIHEQEQKLYKNRRAIIDEMKEAIEVFNKSLNNSLYELHTDYNDKISWSHNEWEVRRSVERKLAIALLSNDWQERLPEIISSIASQFIGE